MKRYTKREDVYYMSGTYTKQQFIKGLLASIREQMGRKWPGRFFGKIDILNKNGEAAETWSIDISADPIGILKPPEHRHVISRFIVYHKTGRTEYPVTDWIGDESSDRWDTQLKEFLEREVSV